MDLESMNLVAEVERLKRKWYEARAEVERLKAHRDQLQREQDIAIQARETIDARIEAALAIAERRSLQTTSASVIGEMVKALTGGRE